MITEFKIGAAHTINLGDFNSMRVEAQLTVAVSDLDDLEVLKDRAQTELRKLLEDTFRVQQRRKNGPQ